MNSTLGCWLSMLFPWRQCRVIEQAGGEAARQCHGELWPQIYRHLAGMSVAETRGYVRARAAGPIAAEVDWALHRHHLPEAFRASVMASGIEQLVAMIVRDALHVAPESTRRAAAA